MVITCYLGAFYIELFRYFEVFFSVNSIIWKQKILEFIDLIFLIFLKYLWMCTLKGYVIKLYRRTWSTEMLHTVMWGNLESLWIPWEKVFALNCCFQQYH